MIENFLNGTYWRFFFGSGKHKKKLNKLEFFRGWERSGKRGGRFSSRKLFFFFFLFSFGCWKNLYCRPYHTLILFHHIKFRFFSSCGFFFPFVSYTDSSYPILSLGFEFYIFFFKTRSLKLYVTRDISYHLLVLIRFPPQLKSVFYYS